MLAGVADQLPPKLPKPVDGVAVDSGFAAVLEVAGVTAREVPAGVMDVVG